MYENAATIQFQSGAADEALLILQAYVAPVLREQAGLLSLCLIPDRDANKITVVSLWASPAHARAVEAASAYRKEIARLDPLLTNKPVHPVQAVQTAQHMYQPFGLN